MNVVCNNIGICQTLTNSKCVTYEGAILSSIGVNTNDSVEVALVKINTTINDILTNCCSGGGGDTVFENDITFVLSSGKSFGKYTNGDTAPWQGLTAVEALIDAAVEYIAPVWNSWSVNQATTVEVGEFLSGFRTATWNISDNSGDVNAINIIDVTGSTTLVSGTANDGSQVFTITTRQLNSNGATQIWRGEAINLIPPGLINSSNYTVIARYKAFYGTSPSHPTSSADIRALSGSTFVSGGGSFIFATGTTNTKFIIALPSGRTLVSVIDLGNLSADITSQFIHENINVNDAGGTPYAAEVYVMTNAIPYPVSSNLQVTFI